MWGRLFGFADTKTNAQSGRPEAPISWGADIHDVVWVAE